MAIEFEGTSSVTRPISLSQQVVNDLRTRIINDNISPGTPLPSERELCSIYGVSRTVIREAIKTLSARGLVESIPGSGLAVGQTKLDDVAEVMRLFMRSGSSLRYDQLHEVRLALEVSVAGIASGKTSPELKRELYLLCDALEDSDGNLVRASQLDYDFHRAIARASENSFFDVIFEALEGALVETRVATFSMDPSRLTTVVAAHRRIAHGIAVGDVEVARAEMTDHLIEVKATWDSHPEMVKLTFPTEGGTKSNFQAKSE
ncbi:FadR/GntR family transcriptional regulator [Flaviflexus massiliensis]|uniref:FadR/GntR family transcriptional regulator n=1 Tax=Flaviflexus massiliensis TaxID=1522309 RepID=UPI0006D53FAE|nr:FadR/GntR family transcriptional regulator [Flaviflexus massiliensis]